MLLLYLCSHSLSKRWQYNGFIIVLKFGCTFSHLCISGWYLSFSKQNKKETRLEQSWPFLKKPNFHSQLPWLCCCYRIINDNRIYIYKKKKKKLSRLTVFTDLIWPKPSCSTCPVRITCLTSFSRLSTQLLGSVCNRFYRRHGGEGGGGWGCWVLFCCINRRRWWTTNCEVTLRVNSNNCRIQLLLCDLGQVRWWKSSAMLRGSEKHSLWLATAHLVSSFFFFPPPSLPLLIKGLSGLATANNKTKCT